MRTITFASQICTPHVQMDAAGIAGHDVFERRMADRLAIETPGKHKCAHVLVARCKHLFQVGTHAGCRGLVIDCNSHPINLRRGKSQPVVDEAVKICGCKGTDSQFHKVSTDPLQKDEYECAGMSWVS